MSRRQHVKYLLPILGAYLILALYEIDRQSLWEDEYLSVLRLTSRHAIWKDGHGFLYFALLDLWNQLGTSELILRSLSVVLGGAAVCANYALGVAFLGRRASIVGTALFATSPFFIAYSQEVRYITLMLLTTLLMMYAFHSAISNPRIATWLVYCATALLAFFSFLSTLLLPAVQGLYLLGSPSRRPLLRKWLFCQIVIMVLFSWWFVNGTHFLNALIDAKRNSQQIRANAEVFPFTGDFNNVRWAVIPYTFFSFSPGFSLGPSPRELRADRSLATLLPHAPMLFPLLVLYGGILISAWLALRQRRETGVFLLLWATIPVFGVFAIAKLLNVFYDVRYAATVLPAYAFILALGIARFRKIGAQCLLLGAVLAVHGIALGNYYFNPRYAREDTRAAAKFLESAVRDNDMVLVVGTLSSLPHYYNGKPALVRFRGEDRHDQPLNVRLQQLSADHDRLWLVQIRPWQVDRTGEVKAALTAAFGLVAQQNFAGVEVYAYDISKNSVFH